jgi:flagellar motor switch protein FliM
VEAQVLGRVSASPCEPREPTAADAALARPLLEAFLTEAEAAVEGTPLAGWLAGPTLGERVASPREAALLLRDGRYRAVRLTLDLGAGERQGLVLILALVAERPAQHEPTPTVAPQVLRSEARLDAVLHRLHLPLSEAEGLAVGQVLPLPGVTVASARIEAGGVVLGPARLGQVAGMCAVRIETPLAPDLAPIPTLPDGQGASLLPAEPGWPSDDEGASPAWAPTEPVGELEPWKAPLDPMEAAETWPLAVEGL